MTNEHFSDLVLKQLEKHSDNVCLFFTGNEILVNKLTMNPILSMQETLDALDVKILNIHQDRSLIIINCEIDFTKEKNPNEVYTAYHVKRFLAEVDPDTQSQILRAYHWRNWHNQSKYCGKCGSLLEDKIDTPEKKCLACNISVFPRFSPAVMVLIQKEDRILLARSPHFQPSFYSAIAGFIDIGETAEHAAHREVKEELGLEITDLEYFSTQTWPFPDSFMIAFKAQYLRGELKLDENEIEDARWFSAHDLPQLPPSSSIARQLIDSVIKDYI